MSLWQFKFNVRFHENGLTGSITPIVEANTKEEGKALARQKAIDYGCDILEEV